MKEHTYFKIGGPADVMAYPQNINDVSRLIKFCNNNNIDYFVLGNGTNLLVRDKGIRGLVIKVDDNLNDIKVECNKIIAEAGAKVSRVAKMALKNSLTGLEGASGIPGSLGGGVAMNAGAYGTELKDVITKVKCIDENGDIKEYSKEEMHFGYRHSRVHEEKLLVVEVEMEMEKGNYDDIKNSMDDYTERRNTKQPIQLPSAGSTFKRPEGDYAGRLIDVSGLRGFRYKDAQVSEKHCGFVVNLGNATCEDVLTLIKTIQKTVKDRHGVELQREVLIVGEE
ncbi:UDP-N-acetylmuramate dehydrogenase [Clostridium sp. D2Q-11]|uniref:UDP-N-acetylenolpyruvoylglucosamine reductase n=2 Tax=Anaeromonas frigoriresistens TaxID=2683708 RepID=A0A942UZN9_9FIRM|nr:UDP-N-acetylmuramate dehydrogenase [Anaeromonas frigoriresistens]